MTLEELTAQLNSTTFWGEFTFSETRFLPRPKHEVELADGIVKLGTLALIFQLKERTEETEDPGAERQWFRRKILRKAVDQIKDSLRYLAENDEILLTNAKGHSVPVRGADLKDIKKVIVFSPGAALPDDCLATQFHRSETAGFIHIVAANDYLGILEKLRVPDDVRLYLDYRETVLPQLKEQGITVTEPDIMVGFLEEKTLPAPNSIHRLEAFIQDLGAFDLSPIMRGLETHIVNAGKATDYYRIMEEFARVPRSVWRAFKERLVLSLNAATDGEYCRPSRFAFPRTGCTFMIASLDPTWPATGEEGVKTRSNAVAMFTEMAKYDLKTPLGVGLLISKDGEYLQLDWCMADKPWAEDAKLQTTSTRPLSSVRLASRCSTASFSTARRVAKPRAHLQQRTRLVDAGCYRLSHAAGLCDVG